MYRPIIFDSDQQVWDPLQDWRRDRGAVLAWLQKHPRSTVIDVVHGLGGITSHEVKAFLDELVASRAARYYHTATGDLYAVNSDRP
jgi:hypothetical protein